MCSQVTSVDAVIDIKPEPESTASCLTNQFLILDMIMVK